MSDLMERLCEAVLGAVYSVDCDGFQCARGKDPVIATAIVRAVLKELREPDAGMLNAARDWSDDLYGKPIGNAAASGCWQAMIDAALAHSADA